MTIFDRITEAQKLLGKDRKQAQTPEEKELYLLAIDALWFVWMNGQSYEFESYRKDVESKAPPRVIASFNTRDEAEAWLGAQPEPPDLADVLIADEYHVIMSSRDRSRRLLVPDSGLEYHIEEMTKDGLPPAVATFNTREEADAWFGSQTAPPAQTVIQIGGERYLAVFYRNINHRALFPFSVVERLHARRKRREQEGTEEGE
ncbi:head protein [Vitiosangium sp. GDMCC 1.1324]|uniref:head protein n=1 Tax=Vitiosangium sp. (strain GDMCC 1.1324) TaxID=2138576 RepID=UPI000D344E19|nr:head protein [Vitiosangium sp. GDMCC 1.1324]PTL77149.1 head protein [Vitiosangium sp. GDMCC 1.1324]